MGQVLAWSLPLVSSLLLVPNAQAQVATSLDWGVEGGGGVDFPEGTTQNTYTDVGGSGVDVRVTVGGDVGNNGNPNLNLTDSAFVSPAPPDETLLINLLGNNGDEATVTIEFFLTGTTTPVDVTLASFPIYDLDILINNGTVSWQDEVVVSASSGGTPIAGLTTSDGPAVNEGIFNQEVIGPNSVTITGAAPGDDPNNPANNANSPRTPAATNPPQTSLEFQNGNVTVDIPNAADTISLLFRNGPGTQDFAPHAIAIGDIAFTAPVLENPAIGVSKQAVSATTLANGNFEVVYETTVENLGDVALNNVQLTEDLDGTYGEGAFTITAPPTFTARGLAGEVALTPNPNFDADAPNGTPGDTSILAAGQTLQVGENSTFRFTVEVDSTLITTPDTFLNQIEATGVSPGGTNVDDLSDDGVEPDPNPNDGQPGDGPDEDTPTPVTLPPAPTPAIGVSKRVVSAVTQPDGDFEVVYETTVENLGGVTLTNVRLVEDLDPTYGEGSFTIISPPTFTARGVAGEVTLAANAAFDGDAPNGTPGDTEILAANQTLQIGESSTFRFTVEVDSASPTLGPVPGTFENQIEAIGTSPTGAPVNDLSNDGTEPDPNPGDGQPGNGPNEDTPTPVTLPPVPAPAIGVSKRVVSASTQADGDFEVVYETTVENLGDVVLTNVQLTEDLDPTYGEGSFTILVPPTFTARGLAGEVTLAVNAGFDADAPNGTPGDTNILAAGQTLQVGENSTFQFTVEIDNDSPTLGPIPGTFENQIEAVGTPPTGAPVSDLSDDGTEQDANPNDGQPGNGPDENTPTPVVLPPTPVIGVAKQVVSTAIEPAGTFGTDTVRVTYSIVVANVGTVPLEQVQLDENLDTVYGTGTFQVVSLTPTGGATTVAADPAFDGIGGGNTTLLADTAGTPTGTLAIGATSTFQLVVDVNAGSPNLTPALPGPYDNQIEANATDAAGNPTSDLSDSGTDVDPDGDGDPNEDGPEDPDNPANDGSENTPTRVRFSPDLRLVKRITRVTRGGADVAIANIGSFNDQAGDTNDNTLATLSGNSLPLGLANITDELQSGDIVEYTVYFFNAGLGTAENLEFCDELQPPSVLQPTSLTLAQPTALSAAGTTLNFSNIGPLSPRAPLSTLEPSCISAPGSFPSGIPAGGLGVGAGGGVVVGGPTSGLNIDANSVGAFRFEIQIP
ncbi:MAG: hypothetical protein AAGI45_01865 [Cyanobacteria bacterium P01_H01_bin.26]